MEASTFDPCLLLTTKQSTLFGMVGMQTDDTLILGTKKFLEKEEEEIIEADLMTKPIQVLTTSELLTFNSYTLTL
jgi:hypothetical protein